jgi:hypothetical protein
MLGEAHERTNITRGRTVKKLYFASGFSAIRTGSEKQLKTANGELAKDIQSLMLIYSSFSVTTPVPRSAAISRNCSRALLDHRRFSWARTSGSLYSFARHCKGLNGMKKGGVK